MLKRHAEISQCGRYRYLLELSWAPLLHGRTLVVCMLNPSTADASQDDATVRWWLGWSRRRDYTAIRIINLAAYRATDQRDLFAAEDPHGIENACYLVRHASVGEVVCAWGNGGPRLPRFAHMVSQLTARRLCLAVTKSGQPTHPLRRSHSLELMPWRSSI